MKFTASIFKFRPFETGRNLRVEFRCRSFKSNALNACRKDILNLSLVIQEKSHRLTFSGCSLYGLANIFSILRRKEECWNTGVLIQKLRRPMVNYKRVFINQYSYTPELERGVTTRKVPPALPNSQVGAMALSDTLVVVGLFFIPPLFTLK
jgi:hypothetical protein